MLKFQILFFLSCMSSLYSDFTFITKEGKTLLSSDKIEKMERENEWMNSSDYYTNPLQMIDCTGTYYPQRSNNYRKIPSKYITFKGFDHGHFFDRKSDKLVIVIPPFKACCKDIVRFAAIYKEYDILLLSSGSDITIKKALAWAYHERTYTTVIGSALCYGAINTLKVQKEYEQLHKKAFDILVIDSCPSSYKDMLYNIGINPVGVISFGTYDSPWLLKKITDLSFVRKVLSCITFPLSYLTCLADYIKNITIPILYVVGREDYLVTEKQFIGYFNASQHPLSSALVTPFRHIRHSLKCKEIYRLVVKKYIETVLTKSEIVCAKKMNAAK